MARLLVHVVRGCAPERFGQLAAGLVEAVAEPDAPPRLLLAELAGAAALLGRHQRRASAVHGGPCARRFGGGRAANVGQGTIGLLFATHDFGVPLDRVLNRFVRPLDRGLTRCLGAPVSYFGRDHVVARGGQLALVSQEARLFEAVIAAHRPLELAPGARAYPAHGDPRVEGLRSVTLGDADTDTERVVAALADAYGAYLQASLEPVGLPAEAPPLAIDEDEGDWLAGDLVEVPIGFCQALVRRLGDRVAAVRLRGDFIAPAALVRAIEARLAHAPIDDLDEMAARVADAWRTTPGAFIHGVVDLGAFARAVHLAANRAS